MIARPTLQDWAALSYSERAAVWYLAAWIEWYSRAPRTSRRAWRHAYGAANAWAALALGIR